MNDTVNSHRWKCLWISNFWKNIKPLSSWLNMPIGKATLSRRREKESCHGESYMVHSSYCPILLLFAQLYFCFVSFIFRLNLLSFLLRISNYYLKLADCNSKGEKMIFLGTACFHLPEFRTSYCKWPQCKSLPLWKCQSLDLDVTRSVHQNGTQNHKTNYTKAANISTDETT